MAFTGEIFSNNIKSLLSLLLMVYVLRYQYRGKDFTIENKKKNKK